MCGISGIYKFKNGEVTEGEVTQMRETLVHRGPDSGKNYISPDKKVGFGFRRLAILDLTSAGDQPMSSPDGKTWIVFNGEIYNFKEIRKELEKKHSFTSQSDTEVILAAYKEWGTNFINFLNGMFALAIWDEEKKIFFAARDHVGIKPFYYAVQNDTLYFGSEIKAILAHPDFKKELDAPQIGKYLGFGFVPAPFTLFKDVKKLPAAHWLMIDERGNTRVHEYWNPLANEKMKEKGKESEDNLIEELDELLRDSIRKQMVSDVPFGCFLSGGIDSSLNATLMSKALGSPVETFSIAVKGYDKYSELGYAEEMAKLLHAKWHPREVDFSSFLDFLPLYGTHADDPNGDPTCFLVYYLSQIVRDAGVVVVQTGEGGDELFAGYDAYKKAALLHPHWNTASKLGLGKVAALLGSGSEFQREYARRFKEGEDPYWGLATAFTPFMKQELLAREYKNNDDWFADYDIIAEHYKNVDAFAPGLDYINRMSYLDLKMRLADFLLMRVDKMGMAHSIEARVPFLDRRIVELSLRIPSRVKLKGGELKHALKKVGEKELPKEIVRRKKQGFGAPLEEWFRDLNKSKVLLDMIMNSKLASLNYFDYQYVHDLHARHLAGENHTFRLMTLLTLSLWYDRWFE